MPRAYILRLMLAIDEQHVPTAGGGILYDGSRLRKPDASLFSRAAWQARGALEELAGGRDSVAVLRAEQGRWILRHYRRGGLVAKLSEDRYLWSGPARTRSFAEWRLLAELYRRGLPVPRPVAAQYVRAALTYRADLITEQLPATQTLANAITAAALAPDVWRRIGRTVAEFHRYGVHHADLNAHNILVSVDADSSSQPSVYILDFDRGRLRRRGSWEARVLARLHRSLEKIRWQRPGVQFGGAQWGELMRGYAEGLSLVR